MKIILKYTVTSIMISMMFWGCEKASGQGSFTLVMSGSVHGQLDPCG